MRTVNGKFQDQIIAGTLPPFSGSPHLKLFGAWKNSEEPKAGVCAVPPIPVSIIDTRIRNALVVLLKASEYDNEKSSALSVIANQILKNFPLDFEGYGQTISHNKYHCITKDQIAIHPSRKNYCRAQVDIVIDCTTPGTTTFSATISNYPKYLVWDGPMFKAVEPDTTAPACGISSLGNTVEAILQKRY